MENNSDKKTPPCSGHDAESVKIESSSDDRPVLHTEWFIELLSKEDQKVFRPENFQSDKK